MWFCCKSDLSYNRFFIFGSDELLLAVVIPQTILKPRFTNFRMKTWWPFTLWYHLNILQSLHYLPDTILCWNKTKQK